MENQNSTPNEKSAAKGIILGVLLFSIGYAVLRYHIMGPVPWKDFPFFIMNKGFALASFLMLTINFSLGPIHNVNSKVPQSWLNARKAVGMAGFLIALIHVLMSFLLFNPNVFGKFFEANGTMTLFAGLSMLGGVLAFVFLWGYNLSFQTKLAEDSKFIKIITSRKVLIWALLLGLVHLFFMGFKGWMNPDGWHGGMPPISLVAFVFGTIGYIFNLIGRK